MAKVKGRTCSRCVYWGETDGSLGYCRRYSPRQGTPLEAYLKDTQQRGIWPMTLPDDWCGEFRAETRTPQARPADPGTRPG